MSVELKEEGQRVYLVGLPFALKDKAKEVLSLDGKNFDRDKKLWWVGRAKIEKAKEFVSSIINGDVKPEKQDPKDIRLTGKGIYKGREYYAGGITNDGMKVRLLTLPNDKGEYLDFWALCSEVEQTKSYQPREYRGRMEYTTLGGIAAFIVRQKRDKGTGRERVQCPECDAWGTAGEPCRECGGC